MRPNFRPHFWFAVFHVTDLNGRKIRDEKLIENIQKVSIGEPNS
jgi:hypothetical protein